MKIHFSITGTHCQACKKLIEKRISVIEGVESVMVDFSSGAAEVTTSRSIPKAEFQQALIGTEYKVV